MNINIVMSVDRITLITLVDITPTGVTHATAENEFQRNQQRNWESVLQCIGIVAQPTFDFTPVVFEKDVKDLNFGEMYEGVHKVWAWSFTVEHEGVFQLGDEPLGRLEEVFNQVPVITYLDETAKFILPIFYTQGAIRNIYFRNSHIDL